MTTHQINFGFHDITCGDYLYAIYTQNTQKVKELLDGGQDPFERDSDGNGPFFWASFLGDVPMIHAIADAQRKKGGIHDLAFGHLIRALPTSHPPVDPNAMKRFELLVHLLPDHNQWIAQAPYLIELAARRGADPQVIKFLLGLGVSANFKEEKSGNTPLHHACWLGRADLVQALLEASPDLNAVNRNGETPLRTAINVLLLNGLDGAAECAGLLRAKNAAIIPALGMVERILLWRKLKK